MTQPVVVVGGSVSGLMQALQFRREGRDVIILEQDPDPERASNGYGMTYLTTVDGFLQANDITGVPRGYPTTGAHVSLGKWVNPINFEKPMTVTSWGLFYRILRANFDGYASKAVPRPPELPVGHGKAEYRGGARVTGITESGDKVVVQYVNVADGMAVTIETDQVIGADGSNSTVRDLVGAKLNKNYSGYIVWRGMVNESDLTESTREFFASGFNLDLMWRGYLLCYKVPSDQGDFSAEGATMNYLLYENVADGSSKMEDIFTDTKGRLHQNTVPRGTVRPEMWDRARVEHLPYLAPPFAELLAKTDHPFVSKIGDGMCDSPSYFGGKVTLVGEAFCSIRPHTGAAAELSAVQNELMVKLRRGGITPGEWEEQVRLQSWKFMMAARAVGEFGQSSIVTFARHLYAYLMA
ncbi:hypothetical protein FAVG1_02279 [Fusarium avenaceum]|nr:hypothetical protein FAVG1_02279 [Fusarium avenaceum]